MSGSQALRQPWCCQVTGDLWEFLLSVEVSRANGAAHPSPANPALKQGSSWHVDSWGIVRFVFYCGCNSTK